MIPRISALPISFLSSGSPDRANKASRKAIAPAPVAKATARPFSDMPSIDPSAVVNRPGSILNRIDGRYGVLLVKKPCATPAKKISEEHTSELQSLMRISYAVFCLTKKKTKQAHHIHDITHSNSQHNK